MKDSSIITKKMTVTGALLAVAIVLEYTCSVLIPFFNMPQGGHISLSAVAFIIIGLKVGLPYALFAGIVTGVIQPDKIIITEFQFFLDYLFPFALVSVGSFLNNIFKPKGRVKANVLLCVGIAITTILRFISHTISGVMYFMTNEEYIPPEGPFWGSVGYNAPYCFISGLIVMILSCIIYNRIVNYDIFKGWVKETEPPVEKNS